MFFAFDVSTTLKIWTIWEAHPRRSLSFRAFLPLSSPHLFAPATHASPDEAIVRNKPAAQVRIWKKNVAARSEFKKLAKFQFPPFPLGTPE